MKGAHINLLLIYGSVICIQSTKDVISCNAKGKSLMKSKNNRGSKMDPWGTSQFTADESDNSLFITTRWVLLNKYDLNQDKQASLHL